MDNDDARMTTIRDIKRFEKEKQHMAARIVELETQVDALRLQVDEMGGKSAILLQEQEETKQAIIDADNRARVNKEIGAKFEKMCKEKDAHIEDLSKEIKRLQEIAQTNGERIDSLESQLEQVGSGRQDLIDQNTLILKLKKQLNQATVSASREQNDVQNTLQSTSMMLQEMRLEYERFTETSRAEFREQVGAKDGELESLRNRFERANHVHYENARQLLLEQNEMVNALRNQFDEYRKVAEHMFLTEAKKMESKLNAQSQKHEQEMRYVVRAKDLHFRRMVTAKDAKIMNLIEGTDLQAFLVKHEIELEHLRRQHERDLEIVKEEVEEAQTKQFQALQNKLAVQELDLEKAMQAAKDLETKLSETLDVVRQSRMEMAAKEAAHLAQMNEMQEQVRLQQGTIDDLTRQREVLRHRLVRLKLKLTGEGKDDLESLLKRLTMETSRLSHMFASLGARHKTSTEQAGELRAQLDRQRQVTVALKHDLNDRTEKLCALTKAFERFLQSTFNIRTRNATGPTSSSQELVPATSASDLHLIPLPDDAAKEESAEAAERDVTDGNAFVSDADYDEILHRMRMLGRGMPLRKEFVFGAPHAALVANELETMAPPLAGTVKRSLEVARPKQAYRQPAKLSLLLDDQVFVRQHNLHDLQASLDKLNKFKAITAAFKGKDNALEKIAGDLLAERRNSNGGIVTDGTVWAHGASEAAAASMADLSSAPIYGAQGAMDDDAVRLYDDFVDRAVRAPIPGDSDAVDNRLKVSHLQPDFEGPAWKRSPARRPRGHRLRGLAMLPGPPSAPKPVSLVARPAPPNNKPSNPNATSAPSS